MTQFPRPTPRPMLSAIMRGLAKRCPACGTGRLFATYVGVENDCAHCGTALHHQRADDAPPYFTIFIVGHIVIPLMLVVEKIWHPDLLVHFLLWLPLTAALSFAFLPRIKGGVIGLQWALRMHGFANQGLQR